MQKLNAKLSPLIALRQRFAAPVSRPPYRNFLYI